MTWAYLDVGRPFAVAHRGGNEVAAENTVAAFDHAVGLGYRYLETDVHVTSDGVLIAFHDSDLVRTAGLAGRIAEHTWSELRAIDLGDGARIPTLDELLATFPDARWNIDPKTDDAVDPLVRTILDHKAIERVCIGSFSDERIARAAAALGPALCTSAGPRHTALLWGAVQGSKVSGRALANPVVASVARKHGCLQVPPKMRGVRVVDTSLVAAAHELGMQVHVWTINDPAEMHALYDAGVDGVMSDRVTVLRSVLEDRGHW